MKRVFLSLLVLAFGLSALAQQNIQLRSADKAECVKSDMTSLKASFSFSTITAEDYASERGTFSWLSMANTVIGGNEGDPQIPVINELIAVPFGALPRVEITSYSTTDYRLEDLGIHTLVPRQPSLRKDQRPEDVPFVYNEAAYRSTRGFRSEPQAVVGVEGIMRGVQLGKMTIEPVSYDPVNNTLRVFNDIEVTVHFDGADRLATEEMLLKTYSPYFDIVYKQLFNGRAITSVYDQHPDLYSTPVKMLVVTTSTYVNSTAFQNWLTWKKQKGIDVDVQTVASGASASTIKNLIYSRYNATYPSFLVIVGDETVVTNYSLWDYDSSYGNAATDLEYASVDGDIYHDMYMSRMPVSSTTQLGYLVDKTLMYEKYTMPDPSYLNETLLIAGWDSQNNWTNKVGKQTIQYANNNYFNSAHGITPHVFITTGSNQNTCYNYINQVGFVNYTAHGDIQEWADPEYTNSNVNSMTNANKPLWAMGNCCLTCNFKNAQNSQTCFGETIVRAQNKAAFGYIGSVVESYWFEDFYFGVGAFNAQNSTSNNPTLSGTSTGAYDAMFDDTGFNTLNSVPYIGNIAVSYAYANNYTNSSGSNSPCNPEYYWRCYQCFGDGSVMPYHKVPDANNVSHNSSLPIGATSFTVNADARSYVSITVNNEIIGVAAVPANATSVEVPITAQTTAGTAMIVVTRNQRQPYITTIPIEGVNQYTISTNINPTGAGNVAGAGNYYENEVCTLTATVNHGYAFDNWTLNNNVVSTNPTYTFTVTGNADYTANFHALTSHSVTCNPVENGYISATPATAYEGDLITLTATPDAGYNLDHWDVRDASNNPITVTSGQFVMPDSDVTVSATFKQGYSITVPYLIGGTITASVGAAQAGETVTLSVTPNTGYTFMEWNVYQTSNPGNTVTVTNNRFRMPAYDVTVSAVFGVPTQVQVEDVDEIGTGTSTNQNIPTLSTKKYSLTEQIYTAAELGEAGTITGIELHASRAQSRTLQIYMVSTDKSSFTTPTDWIKPSSSNMVYNGSVSFTANNWTTITFSTPFAYDGTSNVALIVDDNTNSTNSQAMAFYVYTASSNQAMYINGTTNYNPTSITNTASGRLDTKNRINVHITRLETQNQPLVCEAVPTNVTTSNVTPEGATISWSGEADSYNLRYRITAPKLVYDFETTTPFEVDNFSPCTTYDGDATQTYGVDGIDFDNEGYTGSFIAFQNGLSDSWASHGGDMFGACLAANGATNNDWFILPALSIESGDQLSFWARSLTNQYGLERIKVGVYRNSGTFSSYLAGSASTYIEVPVDWTNYSYDLSAYAGQTIQLAINCVSNDAFALFLDDISIASVSDRWDRTITNVTSPYIFTDLPEETIYEVQVQGVCDGIGGSEWVGTSFTTLSWCSAPSDMYSSNVSATSAILNWTGYQDSYNVQYRTAGGRETLLYEGFDDETLSSDWTTSGLGSNSGVDEGMFVFARNGTMSQTTQYLISPQVNITESDCYLVYYHVAYQGTATIQIGFSSTTNATGAFTWGTSHTISQGTSFSQYNEEIPTGTKYVGIRVNSISSSSAYYIIDDFMILGPYIEPGTWQTVSNVTSPCTISGLGTETNYEWQVQGNCSNGTTNWSATSSFTTHSLCDAPVGLTATDITANSATLNWSQELDGYNVQYRTSAIAYFYDDLDGIIGDWSIYNLADGSSFYNGVGVDGSSCFVFMYTQNPPQYLISPDLIEGVGGKTFKFAYKAFNADYTETFEVGYFVGEDLVWEDAVETNSTDWQEYVTTVPEGATNFIIQCTSNDQYYLLVDNFKIYDPNSYAEPGAWTTLFNSVTGPVTATGLAANTGYDWKVQGVDCGGGTATNWSRYATFTTAFGLTAGSNWWTPTTAMTLEQLEEALGGQAVLINTQDAGFARYEGGQWSGTLTAIAPGQMYKIEIETTAPVSLTLSGAPATGVSVTLLPGYNWFGYTGSQAKDIATVLGSFTPTNYDTITDEDGHTVTYTNGRWSGALTLTPGHGYVYNSKATQSSTLSF